MGRLRAALEGQANVHASIGVATWAADDEAEQLLIDADAAMYAAKREHTMREGPALTLVS